MGRGLLGALAGLGQGLSDVGTDIMRRREQALEDARREAEYQRRLADKREDRAAEQDFDIQKTAAVQERIDARTMATIEAGDRRQGASFKHQETMAEIRAQQAKDLATYKANLSRSNSEAAAKYKQELSQGDVKGIKPGRIRKSDGFVEVIGIRKDGKAFPTGQWVVPNFFQTQTQNFGSAGGGDTSSDLFDNEEDDEEDQ